jgi:CubicO group peptidase (beta-lactamase class C family)
MRTQFAAVMSFLLLCATAQAAQSEIAVKASLDREVPRLLAQYKVPSVSLAQIKKGRLALVAAYGDQSLGVQATPATLYNIASLTKPLTAEIVLRLISSGAFSLDEPMDLCWSDPDIAGDDRRLKLTPRLALSHQTGFPNWRDPTQGLKFLHNPGEAYGYSGEGYVYLARFTEKRTGKPFETLAETYLFDPAKMNDTSYTQRPWFEGRIAIPVDTAGHPLKPIIAKHFNAADLVYTTPRDYAAFVIEVMKNRGLTPEIAEQRSRPQISMMDAKCRGAKAATCPPFTGFGLGWQILDYQDGKVMAHTGRDEGVFTFAYIDRSTGDGAVIFTNGDNGDDVLLPVLRVLGVKPAFLRYLQAEMN